MNPLTGRDVKLVANQLQDVIELRYGLCLVSAPSLAALRKFNGENLASIAPSMEGFLLIIQGPRGEAFLPFFLCSPLLRPISFILSSKGLKRSDEPLGCNFLSLLASIAGVLFK